MDGLGECFRWKMKVKWDNVCKPTSMGGLGIIDLDKFGRALRLRWPWLEWTEPERAWVGLGRPCNYDEMELFHNLTSVTVGDGRIAKFWHTPLLDGVRLKEIAPLVFAISSTKNFTVAKTLDHDFWIRILLLKGGITVNHISEFYILWSKLQEVHLIDGTSDSIAWTLSPSGIYSTSSAYLAQCEDPPTSFMKSVVWENWAPPSAIFSRG